MEDPFNPGPESAEVAGDMVFLAHVGIEEIADGVLPVEADEQAAIAEGDVAGHDGLSFR
jgi:hypothetical protein